MIWFRLFAIVLLMAFFWEWVANIVALASLDFKQPCRAEALRGIGIVVAPMGAVLGYMDLEDGEPE